MSPDLLAQLRSRYRWRSDLGLLFEPYDGTFHRVVNDTAQRMVDLAFAGRSLGDIANEIAGECGAPAETVAADVTALADTLLHGAQDTDPSTLVPVDKRFDDLLGFPLRLEIELTAACNWNCGFCYNVWKIDPDLTDREVRRIVRSLPAKHLPVDVARQILDEAAVNGCMIVRYSGGETLLHPDALDIFDHGGSLGLYQVVFTNGHFVNEPVAERLARANVRCALVSLHGDRTTHNQLAGHRLAYDKAVGAMRVLLDVGIEVVAEATLVADNVNAILDVVRDAYRLGVRQFGVMRYVPTGRNDEQYAVPITTMLPLMERIDELTSDECAGMQVSWPCAQKFCTSDVDTPLRADDPTLALRFSQLMGSCESGLVWGSVSYDGQLRNCPHSNVYFGDVADTGIIGPWQEMTAAVHQAVTTRPTCQGCAVADTCLGGCHLGQFFHQHQTVQLTPRRPVGV